MNTDAFATELIREAGNLLLERRARGHDIEFKGRHSDLVTDTDRLSEKLLVTALRKAYPRDAILSEESGLHSGSSDYTWVVDPLDGTANFASGVPDFGVILGRMRGAEPVFGAMYVPADDALYLAERGSGATRNGKRISVGRAETLQEVLVDHSFHFSENLGRVAREMQVFRSIWPHVRGIRSSGCLRYLAQLAEGQLGAFIAHELGLWDIVGSSVILEEAGAHITDLDGHPLDLTVDERSAQRRLQAVGANAELHKQLITHIRKARAAA